MGLGLNAADNKYWVGFSRVKGIGAARTRLLLDYFGDLSNAWNGTEEQMRAAGLSPKIAQAFLEVRKNIDLDREMDHILRSDIRIITIEDNEYPKKLLSIEFPPPVIYVKGKIVETDEHAVAVVGTRHISSYGSQVAGELGRFLGQNHVCVISGLARGVDAVAHRAVLEAGGRTIAVLGSGVDVIYPPEHRDLAARIIENGALISDYYPGTPPEGVNFPPRNRIISGLSMATVIVEAGERSGALITAEFAASQGREVFAVPGPIYAPRSKGANRLIRDGALPLLNYSDLLEVLNLSQAEEFRYAKQVLPENDIELLLMKTLHNEPMHIDEIKATLGLPMEKISAALVMMKLKGLVKETENLTYLSISDVESGYGI